MPRKIFRPGGPSRRSNRLNQHEVAAYRKLDIKFTNSKENKAAEDAVTQMKFSEPVTSTVDDKKKPSQKIRSSTKSKFRFISLENNSFNEKRPDSVETNVENKKDSCQKGTHEVVSDLSRAPDADSKQSKNVKVNKKRSWKRRFFNKLDVEFISSHQKSANSKGVAIQTSKLPDEVMNDFSKIEIKSSEPSTAGSCDVSQSQVPNSEQVSSIEAERSRRTRSGRAYIKFASSPKLAINEESANQNCNKPAEITKEALALTESIPDDTGSSNHSVSQVPDSDENADKLSENLAPESPLSSQTLPDTEFISFQSAVEESVIPDEKSNDEDGVKKETEIAVCDSSQSQVQSSEHDSSIEADGLKRTRSGRVFNKLDIAATNEETSNQTCDKSAKIITGEVCARTELLENLDDLPDTDSSNPSSLSQIASSNENADTLHRKAMLMSSLSSEKSSDLEFLSIQPTDEDYRLLFHDEQESNDEDGIKKETDIVEDETAASDLTDLINILENTKLDAANEDDSEHKQDSQSQYSVENDGLGECSPVIFDADETNVENVVPENVDDSKEVDQKKKISRRSKGRFDSCFVYKKRRRRIRSKVKRKVDAKKNSVFKEHKDENAYYENSQQFFENWLQISSGCCGKSYRKNNQVNDTYQNARCTRQSSKYSKNEVSMDDLCKFLSDFKITSESKSNGGYASSIQHDALDSQSCSHQRLFTSLLKSQEFNNTTFSRVSCDWKPFAAKNDVQQCVINYAEYLDVNSILRSIDKVERRIPWYVPVEDDDWYVGFDVWN